MTLRPLRSLDFTLILRTNHHFYLAIELIDLPARLLDGLKVFRSSLGEGQDEGAGASEADILAFSLRDMIVDASYAVGKSWPREGKVYEWVWEHIQLTCSEAGMPCEEMFRKLQGVGPGETVSPVQIS